MMVAPPESSVAFTLPCAECRALPRELCRSRDGSVTEFHPARLVLSVLCPRCGAAQGEACVTPAMLFHAERIAFTAQPLVRMPPATFGDAQRDAVENAVALGAAMQHVMVSADPRARFPDTSVSDLAEYVMGKVVASVLAEKQPTWRLNRLFCPGKPTDDCWTVRCIDGTEIVTAKSLYELFDAPALNQVLVGMNHPHQGEPGRRP